MYVLRVRGPGFPIVSRRKAGLLALLGGVMATGCLVELERRVACGDGYVDRAAGEACDPADPERSHIGACAANGYSNGEAACDPLTCQIITNLAQCAVCGDGNTEQGEQCEGPIATALLCPDRSTQPLCDQTTCMADYSVCPSCANGVPDPGEECDPVNPCRGLAADEYDCDDGPPILSPVSCSDLEVLASSLDKAKYTLGTVNQNLCGAGCRYSRETCNFCGDGILDPEHDDLGRNGTAWTRPAERCEVGVLTDYVAGLCADWCGASLPDARVSCNYRCTGACTGAELQFEGEMETADPIADLGCCSPKGTRCGDGDLLEFPCCAALENPGSGDGCKSQVLGTGEILELCG